MSLQQHEVSLWEQGVSQHEYMGCPYGSMGCPSRSTWGYPCGSMGCSSRSVFKIKHSLHLVAFYHRTGALSCPWLCSYHRESSSEAGRASLCFSVGPGLGLTSHGLQKCFLRGCQWKGAKNISLTLQAQTAASEREHRFKEDVFLGYSVYFVWFTLGCFPFLLSEPLKLLTDIRQMNAMMGEPGQLGSCGYQSRGGGCQSLSGGASLWCWFLVSGWQVPVSGTWWKCEELSCEHSYPLVCSVRG